MDQPLTGAQVVDLLRYRQENARLEGLRPRLATVIPFRPLTPRQLEHRTRMLKHLWEVKGQKSEVRSKSEEEWAGNAGSGTSDF